MRKKIVLVLVLLAMLGLGGIVFERASAGQNSNSSTTMSPNTMSKPSRRRHGRRAARRRHRRTRRGRGNANR
jgi:hypothetical protein